MDWRSEGEEEARQRVGGAVGAAALPHALGGGGDGDGGEACDGEVGVEVLAELGDHPIGAHGPGVHPVAPPLVALGDDGGGGGGGGGDERVDGARDEAEASRAAAAAGEEAHHVLVLGRAMEPPLEVGGEERLHGGVVPGVERLVEAEDEELVALLRSLVPRIDAYLVALSGGGAAHWCSSLQLRSSRRRQLPELRDEDRRDDGGWVGLGPTRGLDWIGLGV